MTQLFQYLNKYVAISEDDFNSIKKFLIYKKVKKGEHLLVRGEVSNHMGFIMRGAMRQYFRDDKDVVHSINLYVENCWAGDSESFIELTPSIYSIDAWEDAELLLISREDTLLLSQRFPVVNALLLKLYERSHFDAQKRITSINYSAEKRYHSLIENFEFLVNRFPQYIIASYLGLAKHTLSRIRKKIAAK